MKRAVVAVAASLLLFGGASAHAQDATLGPTGYKNLEIGQSQADAEATGLLVDKQQDGDCTRYYLRPEEGQGNPGGGVWIDKNQGVVLISGTTKSHTPEGITMGSTLEDVRAAYPDLAPVPPYDYVYETTVPEHGDLRYRFAVDEDDRVADFNLHHAELASCG